MKLRLQFWAVVTAAMLLAWLLAYSCRMLLFDIAQVANASMLPYFSPGSWVLIDRNDPCRRFALSLRCRPCTPGEAYVFYHPKSQTHRLVKFAVSPEELSRGEARIASGDIISFTPVAEIPAGTGKAHGTAACYFIGSNSEESFDSRHFGAIAAERVIGRVLWPRLAALKP
ncbi:MAG: S26 family signal peptidase [Turneriella sp.]|nr:S26 family signal peptidase [Turneriella sp.]